nr:UDP-glycosyltransferase [Paris polyphylla]
MCSPPPHALVLPCPGQGHVIPFLELAHCLVDCGFEITFVNTEFNHHRILAALSDPHCENSDLIHFVSIPDGLAPDDDRNDLKKITNSILTVMPGFLEDLIRSTNEFREDGNKITCIIVDYFMAWALAIARKIGLRSTVFFPAAAGMFLTLARISKLTDDGIIDAADGSVKRHEMIQLTPGMPPSCPNRLPWNCIGDSETRKTMFHSFASYNRATETADFIACNSFLEIEEPVFSYAPKLLPIGPLQTGLRTGKPVGHFRREDSSTVAWLDEQPSGSVVYAAFGSFTIFDRRQFQELALGLEHTGRRFLWVVRSDLTDGPSDPYPDGFGLRVANRGKMVGWAPQHRVLAHPSIACFVSHCGWNSTMEGVRNGLRFLCWPYFADQFFNESYICDVWRTGLRDEGR